MLLDQAREGIQVPRAGMGSEGAPSRDSRPRGFDRGVDVCGRALRYRRELLAVRRIDGVEVLSRGGGLPVAADEMLEAVAVAAQPGQRFLGIFWSGTVFHAHEFFSNAHFDHFLGQQQPHSARPQKKSPQALKRDIFLATYGTTKVVPFPKPVPFPNPALTRAPPQLSTPSDAYSRPNTARWHDAPTAARCRRAGRWRLDETFLPLARSCLTPP